MERVKFIEHKGKKILHIDLSDCDVGTALQIIEESRKIMSQQAEGSVLSLTNINNDNAFLPDLFRAMKEFVLHNKPYVKAAAIIAHEDIHKFFIDTMASLTGRQFSIFQDVEQAKDWLVQAV
jgi:hypothetical protein